MSAARPHVDVPSPRNEKDLRWFVLRTGSRQEKMVARDLEGKSVEHYLPLTRRVSYSGSHKVASRIPLFPCYLFLRGTLEEAYDADRTDRVAQLIHVVDQAKLEWELRNIRLAETCDAALTPHAYLSEGDLVEVRCGPFKGLQGVVDRLGGKGQLVLQVDTFSCGASLQIDHGLLDRIS